MPNSSERKSSSPLPIIVKSSTAFVLGRTKSAAECSDSPIPDLLKDELKNVEKAIDETPYFNDEQKADLKEKAEKIFEDDESSLFEILKNALQQPTLRKFVDTILAHGDKYDRRYSDLVDKLEEWNLIQFDQLDDAEVDDFTSQLSPEQSTFATPDALSPFELLSDRL